jgi:site-specific DNA-methyltransferase (adenine-specific)
MAAPYLSSMVRHSTGKNYSLYACDAVEFLDSLPAGSVDVVFADPPYNLSNDGFTVHAGRRVSVNKGSWDRSQGIEKDFAFHHRWIEACRRVLSDNGTIWISGTYHSIYACGFALQSQGWHLLNDIIWFKPNASPNLACRMFTASHETLLWARKTKKAKHLFNYKDMKHGVFAGDSLKNPDKQMRSVWAIGFPSKSEKRFGKHPTQKPVLLLDRIIRASTCSGMVVLDPFCGSGTTGVSAILNGCSFIGVDLEKSYLDEIAKPRLDEAEASMMSRLI